jgi:hypothetical protein
VAAVVLAALTAVACGGSGGGPGEPFPDGWFPIQASSDVGLGRYRVLIGIAGPDNSRLGSDDQPITIAVSPSNDPDAKQTAQGIYTSIVPGVGLYRADFEFDSVGTWVVDVEPADGEPEQTALTVKEETFAPAIGTKAPSVDTPTLDDMPIGELTSDDDPLDSLYEMSIADALTSGRKSVIAFSTPAFCRTEACGPLLEVVKSIVPDHEDVNFIHIEVYTNFHDPAFSPDDATFLAPAVTAWGLPSEPWVFVTDETGTIIGRFEGVVASDEIEAVLDGS